MQTSSPLYNAEDQDEEFVVPIYEQSCEQPSAIHPVDLIEGWYESLKEKINVLAARGASREVIQQLRRDCKNMMTPYEVYLNFSAAV